MASRKRLKMTKAAVLARMRRRHRKEILWIEGRMKDAIRNKNAMAKEYEDNLWLLKVAQRTAADNFEKLQKYRRLDTHDLQRITVLCRLYRQRINALVLMKTWSGPTRYEGVTYLHAEDMARALTKDRKILQEDLPLESAA